MSSLQLFAFVFLAVPVGAVPNPRAGGGWVSDGEGLIPDEAERRINDRLAALERDLGVEIAVVTVSGIDTTPKELAVSLFARWGIGKARADNGLLVLLVRDQRRLEIETGYGLEPLLPDGWLGGMQNEVMVPKFRAGDYAAGIEAGLERIDERLRAAPDEAREGTRREDWAQPVASDAPVVRRGAIPVPWVAGGVGVAGLALGLTLFGLARRRERTCGGCRIRMRLLDEVEDDAHLDPGQRREEAIGSVDYKAYICRGCQGSRTVARRKWFSGFSRCEKCRYRTLATRSDTLVEATYDHGGRVQVTETCRNCDHHHRYLRHTARLARPSSSSSGSSFGGGGRSSRGGGGGSFGGGRSGGGGAGSSW